MKVRADNGADIRSGREQMVRRLEEAVRIAGVVVVQDDPGSRLYQTSRRGGDRKEGGAGPGAERPQGRPSPMIEWSHRIPLVKSVAGPSLRMIGLCYCASKLQAPAFPSEGGFNARPPPAG